MMSETTEAAVRAEVRAWLEANWSVDYGLVAWRNKLIDSGWGVPSWPKDWFGRELPMALEAVVEDEFKRVGAVGVAKTGIRRLAAATLLVHGSPAQREKFLRRSLTGEDTWCQLFSEPGSGSDLAGATTRAEFKGNRWVINGQKVWTTSAHHAGAHRLERAEASGAVVFRARHPPAGRRGASAATDEWACVVQPGVLHRCGGAAGVSGLGGRQGLGGGDDDADA
jgi:alkylation response protein AidB-like acyl-CoA dehydrogenase